MKKLLSSLVMVLLFIGATKAQEIEFTFNNERGMTDYIVIPFEGKTASEIYKKAMDWVKVTYKNPDKVILSTIENEYIRFEGSSQALYAVSIMGKEYYDTKYQIEISIKDGRYKFDLIGMDNFFPSSPGFTGRWTANGWFNGNTPKETLDNIIYKKDGSLKGGYKYLNEVPTYFNNLNKSLVESITSTVKKSDGW